MTKEEALKQLGELKFALSGTDEQFLDVVALEMAIKALEQQPCTDAISRAEAIKVASGFCHWSNIPKELEKLPSVNPKPCEDAISRQAVLDGLASIAKAKARSDAQKILMGRTMFFVEQLPSVTPQLAVDAVDRNLVKKDISRWKGYIDDAMVARMHITIDKLPSIKPTPKMGRWIYTGDMFNEGMCKCSECNREVDPSEARFFCSYCGAKMKEKTETCKGCTNKCIMYEPNMKGCKDKMEGVEE